METTTGLILAFIALFCWGFGDFFIRRACTRSACLSDIFGLY